MKASRILILARGRNISNFILAKAKGSVGADRGVAKAGILGILDTEEHFPKQSRLRNILNKNGMVLSSL